MFSIASLLSIALVAASSASAASLPRHRAIAHRAIAALEARATATAPATWATGYLEDYDVYHLRYLALDCQDKHNTTFFDQCCHPLLATENLKDNRPAQCTPTAAEISSAKSAFFPSSTAATPTGAGGDDCGDESTTPAPTSTAKATPTPQSNNDDGGDCDDGGDESSSSKPSTKTTAPAKATPTPQSNDDGGDDDCSGGDDGGDESSSAKPTTTSSEKTTTTAAKTTAAPTTTAKPTTTKKMVTSTTKTTSTSKSTSTAGLTVGGIATYYTQDGTTGACGTKHSDSDIVCALKTSTYANGKHCGQTVAITNLKNGKTLKVLVADECPGCKNAESIDLSTGAYKALGGTTSEGEFDIAWKFV